MNKSIVAILTFSILSACGGDGTNPFTDPEEVTETEADDGTPIEGDREMPPGTASPTPNYGIFRGETRTEEGNGYAESISYDAASDTFYVDNLGFDAANVYTRGTAVGSLGPFAVYESAAVFPDSLTGQPINQFTHRAIYGISPSTNTQFAIVRTGAYVDYGFGGFVYQRSNGVTIPETGQARYTGNMAGLRDYSGDNNVGSTSSARLDYTTADISIDIDFEDFNPTIGSRGDAIRVGITNRRIYDIGGNDITNEVLTGIENEHEINLTQIPDMNFVFAPGSMDDNGEILGTLESFYVDADGQGVTFESGNFYAIVAGDNAEEIVGVVVLESGFSPIAGTVRETSGFIVYR